MIWLKYSNLVRFGGTIKPKLPSASGGHSPPDPLLPEILYCLSPPHLSHLLRRWMQVLIENMWSGYSNRTVIQLKHSPKYSNKTITGHTVQLKLRHPVLSQVTHHPVQLHSNHPVDSSAIESSHPVNSSARVMSPDSSHPAHSSARIKSHYN